MAAVVLDRVYINLVSDPTQHVAAFSSDPDDLDEMLGEVRRMANGRLRSVARAGSARTIDRTLQQVTPADVERLRSWKGQPVLFRDVMGRKVYCVYFRVQVGDYKDRSGHFVNLSPFQQVTVSDYAA